jgi:hypothetical protein
VEHLGAMTRYIGAKIYSSTRDKSIRSARQPYRTGTFAHGAWHRAPSVSRKYSAFCVV